MGFESFHPAIPFLYFASVITVGILFNHPIFLVISWICSFLYSVKRNGKRAVILGLCLILLAAAFGFYYAGYTHFGVTVMRQNFIGNNMTLESLVYGVVLGIIASTVIMWLSCVFSIFTTDKVVFLFGKISSRMSLLLSIVLRMVPRIKAQAKKIHLARKSIGRGINQGKLFQGLVNGITIFSILITWLLESLATISDSMRSRGYGLKGRTAFSIYRFDNRDRGFVIGIFFCLTILLMAYILGQTQMVFDPKIILHPASPIVYGIHAILCLLPLITELWTEYCFHNARKGL